MQIQVAFSDGFADDTAVIRVDGAEAWRGEGLTTRTQISHAGSAEVEAGDGALVEVEVPTQGLAAQLDPGPSPCVTKSMSSSSASGFYRRGVYVRLVGRSSPSA